MCKINNISAAFSHGLLKFVLRIKAKTQVFHFMVKMQVIIFA